MKMRRPRVPYWASILILGLCLSAPPAWGETYTRDTIEELEGRGLLIRSEPANAQVIIDGVEWGHTPLSLEALSAGEYSVRIRKDGYVERHFRAVIRNGSRLAVFLTLEESRGQVLPIISRSPGSPSAETLALKPRISVEGRVYPESVLDLPTGWRTIRVRAFGWEDAETAVYIREGSTERVEISMKPAVFHLTGAAVRRKRFNPANSGSLGTAEFVFEVSAPGRGRLEIVDNQGQPVQSVELGPFTTWTQSIPWRGKDTQGNPLPGGTYTIRISAESQPFDGSAPIRQTAELSVEIDPSLKIRPLGLAGGIPGLVFTPVPGILPPTSFQLEALALFGWPLETSQPWRTLPFATALRFSPLERLELAAALNITPKFDDTVGGKTVPAFGAAVKWLILRPEERPLGLAAGLSWARTGTVPLSPFGMSGGVEVFFPLSWQFPGPFSIVFSPAALWAGSWGYPTEPSPQVLLSGGLRFETPSLSAALSLRQAYRISTGKPETAPPMVGAELRIFPSNLIFILTGGLWFEGWSPRGFGGLGMGLIY